MESGTNFEPGKLGTELQSLVGSVRTLAQSCQGDCLLLLALLRTLESLHREIRDDLFQASLPDNRQELYKLLRTIETEGGWPYIHRMKLRELLLDYFPHLFSAEEYPHQSGCDNHNQS